MPKRLLPPDHIIVKGVRYVPETPDVATRRTEATKRERHADRVKKLSKTAQRELSRAEWSTTPVESKLKFQVMELRGGLNSFSFEGCLCLPPKRCETKPGKDAMCVFMVGRRGPMGDEVVVYVNAYGELAEAVLARYKQMDHVKVHGKLSSSRRIGRHFPSLAVSEIELVEAADNVSSDVAVLGAVLGSTGSEQTTPR